MKQKYPAVIKSWQLCAPISEEIARIGEAVLMSKLNCFECKNIRVAHF